MKSYEVYICADVTSVYIIYIMIVYIHDSSHQLTRHTCHRDNTDDNFTHIHAHSHIHTAHTSRKYKGETYSYCCQGRSDCAPLRHLQIPGLQQPAGGLMERDHRRQLQLPLLIKTRTVRDLLNILCTKSAPCDTKVCRCFSIFLKVQLYRYITYQEFLFNTCICTYYIAHLIAVHPLKVQTISQSWQMLHLLNGISYIKKPIYNIKASQQ